MMSNRQPTTDRRQRGTVMLLTVVVLIAVLGMLALAIDMGFLLSARTQVQNAMDAAALAGAVNLRATIEPGIYPAPERDRLVRDAAKRFAGFNTVGVSSNAELNKVELDNGDITIDPIKDLDETQQVIVRTTKRVPLFFGELFGFPAINASAAAIASTVPVDGGTGGLTQCWRPLLLPDTFFDTNNFVHWVGDATRPTSPKPLVGDYYRSRFAVGNRNALPFVDTRGGDGGWVTGLRDAQLMDDITNNKTVMGTTVRFSSSGYFIANFSSLPRTTFDALPLFFQAARGFCGRLRVGDEIPVYSPTDAKAYADVAGGLQQMMLENAVEPQATEKALYRYIVTDDQPPNTHPRIIPVLFFNPFELLNRDGVTRLRVTNIGLMYLESVSATGDNLTGFFVRETLAEGMAVERANLSSDSFPRFRRSWLPTSPRLIR